MQSVCIEDAFSMLGDYTGFVQLDSVRLEYILKNLPNHPVTIVLDTLSKYDKKATISKYFKGKRLTFYNGKTSIAVQYRNLNFSDMDFRTLNGFSFVDSPSGEMEVTNIDFIMYVDNFGIPNKLVSRTFYNRDIDLNKDEHDKLFKAMGFAYGMILLGSPNNKDKLGRTLELVKKYIPDFDLQKAVVSVANVHRAPFIYPVHESGSNYSTLCCGHTMDEAYFYYEIEKHEGCPKCKTFYCFPEKSYGNKIIYDLKNLRLFPCHMCNKSCFGFIMKNGKKIPMCGYHDGILQGNSFVVDEINKMKTSKNEEDRFLAEFITPENFGVIGDENSKYIPGDRITKLDQYHLLKGYDICNHLFEFYVELM